MKKENERKNREKIKQQNIEIQKKKIEKEQASKEAFEKWKKKNRKPKNLRTSFAYSEGSLFCYHDMSSNQEPSYTNPIPWVNTPIFTPVKTPSEEIHSFQSPPLLWDDVERRLKSKEKKII